MSRNIDQILGIKITITPELDVIKTVFAHLKNKHKFFIVTPNPEILVLANKDLFLKEVLNSADISLPDGVGIVFAAKLVGMKLRSRIAGRKFFLKLVNLAHENDLKIFLLGGSSAVIEKSIKALNSEFKDLKAEGMEGPKLGQDGKPVNKLQENKEKDCIASINAFKPDVLFIGFGAPKQEKWFYLNKDQLKVGGAMVVGGTFDTLSGSVATPPKFVETLGLEWLWRLINEPKRIGRIINAVFVFPILLLKEKVSRLFI